MSTSHSSLPILLLLSCSLLIAPSPGAAATPDDEQVSPPHVRPLTKGLDERIAEAAVRAPTLAAMLARLEQSDVVAYVACGLQTTLRFGQLQFLAACGDLRYLMIQLRCDMHPDNVTAALGHELRHAVEIADAPSVVDVKTLRALYLEIGHDVTGESSHFETREAASAGAAVRRELDASTRPAVAP